MTSATIPILRFGSTATDRTRAAWDGLRNPFALAAGALVLICVAVPVGAAVSRAPVAALVGTATVALVLWVATHPSHGVYLVVALTPLIAGIDRGSVLPVVRPNEAIAALVGLALFLRWIVRLRSSRQVSFRPTPITTAMLLLALASSVLPLLWLLLRNQPVGSDDLLYTLTIWKFFGVFLIVRAAHLDERQTWCCLYLSIGAAVLVALVAVLQSMHVGPVISLLGNYYTTNNNVGALHNSRGSSLLALPIAVADLLSFNIALVVGIMWVRRRTNPLLAVALLVLLAGVVSAAEFSGILGLAIGIMAICAVTRSIKILRYVVPGGLFAAVVLWPVIETRLIGFQGTYGMPQSWTGRLVNLQTYFWPTLFSHDHYVLGVRPAARIVAPHRANGFIWIESGYTWLLWAGGIPLLLAFCYFAYAAGRVGLRAARSALPAHRVAGLGVVTAITITVVLMIFDPHLTYRGSADALFVLLALSAPAVRHVKAGDSDG
jgi:hypothetical protein